MIRHKIFVCLAAVLLLSSGQFVFGQAVNATLLGTITDSTGAAVADANITATETKTSTAHQSVSNASGNYTFPNLQPGTYVVTVESKGFKKDTHQNITLLVNSSTRVDVSLQPGSVSETVLVTTAPALLQTDRADISTKLETQQLSDLPLTTNRNFQSLLNLVPGMTPATFNHSQFFNAQSSLGANSNGLPLVGNLFQIEGIDDDERTGLLQIIIPPVEAIQSVDVSTNNFDAELGRAMGVVTNVILKSGTNSFHGSAFEFIQNNAVNARSYFAGPLGHLSYNYFGGSLGGPIWKDKLFFFGDYLRSSDHEAISTTFAIPPPTFYTDNGSGFIDLSAPLGAVDPVTGIRQGQIFDPTTGNPDGSGRTPFANNQIPISKVNPVSLALMRLLPPPNQNQSNLASPTNNYATNVPFTKTADSFDVKLDYALNESNHLSGRYSFQRAVTFQAPTYSAFHDPAHPATFKGGPLGGGFQGTGDQKSYSTGVNYDHVFSPTLLTEVRFGVAHLRNDAQPSDYGSDDATAIGIPGVNIDKFTSGQASITIPNFGGGNNIIGYSASMPWIRAEANIDFVNNWTKVIRNHTVKVGVDLRRVRDDLLQDQAFGPRGAFTFGENQTSTFTASNGQITNAGKTNVANDMASFLLDVPDHTGRDLNTYFPAYRQWWFFVFAADKWQLTPKLTVDLGVRWEFYPPATPRKAGGFSNYDPATNSLMIAGIGSNPLNLGMKTRYTYFAPRTGFSYRATDTTVVRGGFGISYMPFADNKYAYNYPVTANNAYSFVTNNYGSAVLSDGQPATFQAGFPAPVPVPIPASGIIVANTPALRNQAYYVIPLDYKNPYAESWNVAVQQALPQNFSLELAYVANHGVRLPTSQNSNFPSTLGAGIAGAPSNIAFGRTAANFDTFQGTSSNYQSLQVKLDRRFSKGLALTSAFTWGKGMNYINTGYADDGDASGGNGLLFFAQRHRNYAPTSFDRRLNFHQSFTYALPAGKGQRWLNSGVGAVVLGGWKISGIIAIVSGVPFTVQANAGSLNTPGTAQTANLIAPYRVLHGIGTNSHWFDPTAFGQPLGVTTGNTGRNQFYGPGYIQDNVSVFKSFSIFREAALEMRLDATQLSNTPQFLNPNSGNIAAGNFGQITSTLGSGQGSVNGIGGGRALQASAKISF